MLSYKRLVGALQQHITTRTRNALQLAGFAFHNPPLAGTVATLSFVLFTALRNSFVSVQRERDSLLTDLHLCQCQPCRPPRLLLPVTLSRPASTPCLATCCRVSSLRCSTYRICSPSPPPAEQRASSSSLRLCETTRSSSLCLGSSPPPRPPFRRGVVWCSWWTRAAVSDALSRRPTGQCTARLSLAFPTSAT